MKKTTGKTNATKTQNVKNTQSTKNCGKGCGKNAKDCG